MPKNVASKNISNKISDFNKSIREIQSGFGCFDSDLFCLLNQYNDKGDDKGKKRQGFVKLPTQSKTF